MQMRRKIKKKGGMDVFVQSAFGHGNPFFSGKIEGDF
jgi:hypothetical protein